MYDLEKRGLSGSELRQIQLSNIIAFSFKLLISEMFLDYSTS